MSADRDSPRRSAALAIGTRVAVGIGVGVGLLASAGLCFLWLFFGGAAAGNSGTSRQFESTFVPVSLSVFGAYALVTLVLYFMRRPVGALLVAWLPLILMVFLMVFAPLIFIF